ncbi:MAG: tetratricopeptide repeat protein [Candidatus Gracilibacteria bacterium]
MKDLVIIGGILVLGLIFLRRYLEVEKGIKVFELFFRPKNLFRHHGGPEKPSEVTVEEFIPSREEVDEKNVAKADSLVRKAEIALKKGDDAEGKKALIQALALDPSCIEAYKKLAFLYLRDGEFGKAETVYKKLVVSISDDPMMLSNLGLALFSQDKLEEAKTYYKKALELDMERPGRFFSLGQIHYALEEFEDAAKMFRRAADMDPGNIDYMLTLAHLYVERELVGEARNLIDEVLNIDPENEEALAMKKMMDSPEENPQEEKNRTA